MTESRAPQTNRPICTFCLKKGHRASKCPYRARGNTPKKVMGKKS